MDPTVIIGACSAVIIFLISFSKGKSILRYLVYLWFFSFNFGARGIKIFDMRIYFMEGITWLIFVLILIRMNFNILGEQKKIFPKITGISFIFYTIGLFIASSNNIELKNSFGEYKVFLMLIPCFYITYVGFKYFNLKIKKVLIILSIGAFALTIIAAITYFAPSAVSFLVPQELTTGESVLIDARSVDVKLEGGESFRRGGGSLWGILLVSAYLGLLLFLINVGRLYEREKPKKIFYLATCILIAITILINGQRSVWVGMLLGSGFYFLKKGVRGIFTGAILLGLTIMFLPSSIILRFSSIFEVNEISWAGRLGRYEVAKTIIRENPFFGKGWASGGSVHNLALQLGANIGIIGFLVFIAWAFFIFNKSLKVYKIQPASKKFKEYHLAFLTGFLVFVGPLMGESTINWPILMGPYWFFCAVLHNFNTGLIQEDSL